MTRQDRDADGAYFIVHFPPDEETFVVRINNPVRIAEARNVSRGREKRRVHVRGRVTAEPADYNPGWSFHLDPDSVSFFEDGDPAADAGVAEVESRLKEVGGDFLPTGVWEPSASRLAREAPPSVRPPGQPRRYGERTGVGGRRSR
jgi:hypothetical protein